MKQNHRSTYRVCTVFVGVLLTLLIGMQGATVSAAEVLLVPDDYLTIQGAVDAANQGDTIFISPGEFAGAVITKTVKIIGSGNETTITSGNWAFDEDAFDIFGSYFDVDGTEIRDLMIDGDDILWGIFVETAKNVTIVNVTVNNPIFGVEALFSDGLTISGSTFNNPFFGLYMGISDGLAISSSTFNNSYRAIDIRNGSDCEVMHSTVIGLKTNPFGPISHSDGIVLIETNDCVVAHNYVWHIGNPVGGYDEEFYVGTALASFGSTTEGNNFHHNRVEVSVAWDGDPVWGEEWSGAHSFYDIGVVEDGLPISIKNNKLMHNNFLGSDPEEFFNPAVVADFNKAKHNLFDE